jgi:hypothetical protein
MLPVVVAALSPVYFVLIPIVFATWAGVVSYRERERLALAGRSYADEVGWAFGRQDLGHLKLTYFLSPRAKRTTRNVFSRPDDPFRGRVALIRSKRREYRSDGDAHPIDYRCALIELGAVLPQVAIHTKGAATLSRRDRTHDVVVDDDRFNERFLVNSGDSNLARQVVHRATVDLLMSWPPFVSIEFTDNKIVYAERCSADYAQVAAMLERLDSFAAMLPQACFARR